MRDKPLIYAGLGLFLLLVLSPVWYAFLTGSSSAGPDIAATRGQGNCVAPKSSMRAEHMTLLMDWRDGKVRQGRRSFTAHDGAQYPVDLNGTCLKRCHGGDHAKFCDRCHRFAGVPAPDCWVCHAAAKAPLALLTRGNP